MTRRWGGLGIIGALWAAALCVVWISPFFVGTPFGMFVAAVAWLVVLAAVAAIGLWSRRWWVAIAAPIVTVVLAAATFNWSGIAPAAYFELHRPLFERAAATAHTDSSYYGARLPVGLRPLSAGGRVRDSDGMLFFPQWLGIPDDAGGYFYSPDHPPEGADMFGTICVDPRDLHGGWWACGL